MKKVFPVLVILVLLGLGWYFMNGSKKMTGNNPVGKAGKETSNVFSSIKDALSKSLSLKCVYQDEEGTKSTTYIKGGSVRVITELKEDKEQPNNVLLKDKKMYMWSDSTMTGFTLDVPDASPAPTAKEQNPMYSPEKSAGQDQESLLAQIEKYKDSCKSESIADSFFVPPTDVKFQDMNDFTKNLMKAIPTNNPVEGETSGDAQKYLEEMMKQISPQAGNDQ